MTFAMPRTSACLLAVLVAAICFVPAALAHKAPAKLNVPEGVAFEPDVEYTNPDG